MQWIYLTLAKWGVFQIIQTDESSCIYTKVMFGKRNLNLAMKYMELSWSMIQVENSCLSTPAAINLVAGLEPSLTICFICVLLRRQAERYQRKGRDPDRESRHHRYREPPDNSRVSPSNLSSFLVTTAAFRSPL